MKTSYTEGFTPLAFPPAIRLYCTGVTTKNGQTNRQTDKQTDAAENIHLDPLYAGG